MTTIHQLFLKSLATLLIAVSASVAFALPTPKDIESAVSAGNYSHAESLLREVLQDKPQSAKAHYELGQVLAHEHRYKDALAELQKAKEIDPSLKFSTSPEKFNEVFTKVNGLATPSSAVVMEPSVLPGTQVAPAHTNAIATTSGGFPLTYVWIAIAALVGLGLWLRRAASLSAPAPAPAPTSTPAPVFAPTRGFGAQFTPGVQPTGYGAAAAQPMNTGGSGSTMTGAVIGGLAGVAAGYALSKALEGDHHDASSAQGNSSANSSASGNGGYVPFETPAQPDLGTFDVGSGNDWDSADSEAGGDDSW